MKPNPADYDERACRDADPEVFFPAGEDISGARQVIATYCAKCPVMDICLEWALDVEGTIGRSGRSGVFGGKTATARWAIYNQRRQAGLVPPPPINHGTAGGYSAHLRRGQKACAACCQAQALAKQMQQERRRKGTAA